MVKTMVDEEHLLHFYHLLSSCGEQTLEISNHAEDTTLFIAKSKSAAKEALQPRFVSPLPLPLHLQRPAPISYICRRCQQQDVDGETHGRFRASAEYDRDPTYNQDLATVAKRPLPNLSAPALSPQLTADDRREESERDPPPPATATNHEEGIPTPDDDEEAPLATNATGGEGASPPDGEEGIPSQHDQEGGQDGVDERTPPKETLVHRATSHNRKRIPPQAAKRKGAEVEETPPVRKQPRRNAQTARWGDASVANGGPPPEVRSPGAVRAEGREEEIDTTESKARIWLRHQMAISHDPPVQQMTQKLQDQMIRTAFAVAGPEAIGDWHEILHYWRHNGQLVTAAYLGLSSRPGSQSPRASPLGPSTAPTPTVHRRQRSGLSKPSVERFREAFERTDLHAVIALLQPVFQRCGLATLHKRYVEAQTEIRKWYGNRGALTQRDAKGELFRACHRRWAQVENPRKNDATASQFDGFERRLFAAHRMHILQEELGLGVFSLIRGISDTFLTQTMRKGTFELWVQLVKQFNPRYRSVEERATRLFQRAVQGRSIADRSDQRLALERVAKVAAMRYVDPGPLFEVDDPTRLSDPGVATPHSRPATPAEPPPGPSSTMGESRHRCNRWSPETRSPWAVSFSQRSRNRVHSLTGTISTGTRPSG